MKRKLTIASLALLFILALTFTQVFASGTSAPGSPAPHKTPAADQHGSQSNNQPDQKGSHNDANMDRKATHQAVKATEKVEKQDLKATEMFLKKTATPVLGERVNYRGVITAINGDKVEITLKNGDVVTVTLDPGTILHIPTMGDSGLVGDLKVGSQIVVHARKTAAGDSVAISLNVIPGEPAHTHSVGVVTAYQPGVSITITGKDGTPQTFDIANAKVVGSDQNVVLDQTVVTIVVSHSESGSGVVVKALVFHSASK